MAKWKVLRRVYHRDDWAYPGQVVEEDERFDGRPNMEPTEDDPTEPDEPVSPPAPEAPAALSVEAESDKGAA